MATATLRTDDGKFFTITDVSVEDGWGPGLQAVAVSADDTIVRRVALKPSDAAWLSALIRAGGTFDHHLHTIEL